MSGRPLPVFLSPRQARLSISQSVPSSVDACDYATTTALGCCMYTRKYTNPFAVEKQSKERRRSVWTRGGNSPTCSLTQSSHHQTFQIRQFHQLLQRQSSRSASSLFWYLPHRLCRCLAPPRGTPWDEVSLFGPASCHSAGLTARDRCRFYSPAITLFHMHFVITTDYTVHHFRSL